MSSELKSLKTIQLSIYSLDEKLETIREFEKRVLSCLINRVIILQ